MELNKWPCLLPLLWLPLAAVHGDRIIGGKECAEDRHPSLVMLYDSTGPYCAGTLINESWVITAAHCYKRQGRERGQGKPIWIFRNQASAAFVHALWKRLQLVLGEHDTGARTGREQFRTSEAAFCIGNTPQGCFNALHDIMLVKLGSPAERTDYVAAIDLATACAPEGTPCCVMGWGTTTTPEETYPNVPYCVDIQILPLAVCQEAYPWEVNEKMICAGVMEGGKDSCRGDSGGPLICNGVLQGIVSLGGFPCAEPEQPGTYTNICRFLDWIQATIGEHQEETTLPGDSVLGQAS
ncbi:hypothetical protein lerEdw1_009812 [Lerista edwardsae]|nr:hypothetical protein lerEdw1_009812 [Lerista edwardsae]